MRGSKDQPIHIPITSHARRISTGQRAAIIHTMVECAKRHGHNPEAWLTEVLERLPAMTNQDDLTVLLPANWQTLAAAATPTRETCPA
jgi:hypothetical protein